MDFHSKPFNSLVLLRIRKPFGCSDYFTYCLVILLLFRLTRVRVTDSQIQFNESQCRVIQVKSRNHSVQECNSSDCIDIERFKKRDGVNPVEFGIKMHEHKMIISLYRNCLQSKACCRWWKTREECKQDNCHKPLTKSCLTCLVF